MKTTRELKPFLATLRAAGVSEYRETPEGALFVRFADASPQEPALPDTAQDAQGGPLSLPDGVLDPTAILARINAQAFQRKAS